MRDFLKDVVLPFILTIILIMTLAFTAAGIVLGISGTVRYNECKVWGGKYNFFAGCLMEYNNKTLTLDDYKRIQAREIIQPITHNIKIKGGDNE